jgi:GntR family transcriptional regulator
MVAFDTALDRASTKPLFAQVEQSLNAAVASGQFKSGERIPTEPELAEAFGVSRITIRRAIDELSNHGVLIKRQGKGTFVQESKVARKIEHIASFSESCRASGMVPAAAVLNRVVLSGLPEGLSDRPALHQGDVLYIQRIHYADGTPIMIENNYYPLPAYGFLLTEPLEGSLFQTLAEHDVRVAGSENSYIDATAALRSESALLDIPVGDPVFVFNTEKLDDRGEFIYVGRQCIAASRYRFLYDAQ